MKKIKLLAISLVGMLHVLPVFVAKAGEFSPSVAEEGQQVTFKWIWPVGANTLYNGGCTISGIPGFTASSKTAGATQHAFYAGKSKIVAALECYNLVNLGGGRFTVDKSYREQFEMLLKPTMSLVYPVGLTPHPGTVAGVVEGVANTLNFSAKNADSCEIRYLSDMNWKTIPTTFSDKFSYFPIPTGGAADISAKCMNSSGVFQIDIRVPVVPAVNSPSTNVSIGSFTHGDIINGVTKLYWSTSYAKSCSMKQGGGSSYNVPTAGLGTLNADAGHEYTLDCTGANGSKANKSLAVTKVDLGQVKITAFSAEKFSGGTAALRWATLNAKFCEISGSGGFYKGDLSPSGIATLRVPSGYNYTLSCTGFDRATVSKTIPVMEGGEIYEYSAFSIDNVDSLSDRIVLSLERDGAHYKVIQESEKYQLIYKFNELNSQYEFLHGIAITAPETHNSVQMSTIGIN